MGMREDCKQFESRSYPNGDTVRKCNLDLAPEAPWRCPDDCRAYERRRVDVNWSYGSLVTPPTPKEPESLSKDDNAIAALLDEAEDIVNKAGPAILAEMQAEDGSSWDMGSLPMEKKARKQALKARRKALKRRSRRKKRDI